MQGGRRRQVGECGWSRELRVRYGVQVYGLGIYLETKSRMGGVARVRWYAVKTANVA